MSSQLSIYDFLGEEKKEVSAKNNIIPFKKEVKEQKIKLEESEKVLSLQNIFFIRNVVASKKEYQNLYKICVELTDYLKEA